jgi:ATP-dependent helicase Lhr and Lhr-like helicase
VLLNQPRAFAELKFSYFAPSNMPVHRNITTDGHDLAPLLRWFERMGWRPYDFQIQTWKAIHAGKSGILNAPTGSGKTLAVFLGMLPDRHLLDDGLQVLWVTPLRALAKDLQCALQTACDHLRPTWKVGVRTGDTPANERKHQDRHLPQCLITTPESLHILFSRQNASSLFTNLRFVVADEWHELMGTKRGVLMELALSRMKALRGSALQVWGISATIGNLAEALEVLLGNGLKGSIIRAEVDKRIEVCSLIPEDMASLPWAGHLGAVMLPGVLEIIRRNRTTLVFTNTRSQTEYWYRALAEAAPDLAGLLAMHHGSIDPAIRSWVENALREGRLKAVVCTSSLDLGVDFSPVEAIVQIGGPKGVSRFMQRAGRSGHQPGALSRIWFAPTHALELIEGAALRKALERQVHEERKPLQLSLDVLVQYLMTLAIGPGFEEKQLFEEIRSTYAFSQLQRSDWEWVLSFITTGGQSLQRYREFARVEVSDSRYRVVNRRIATRHRLSIGTIVSDPVLRLKFLSGGALGTIEESFISMLKPGDSFWFAGRCLEFVRLKDMTAYVVKSSVRNGRIPAWQGGRLPLSSKLAALIRLKLEEARNGVFDGPEMEHLRPLLELQAHWSEIPNQDTLLIESVWSREGHHVYFYPFEGRFVHEVMGALIAWRIGRILPLSFSIAMNDYGFELLSDREIPVEEALEKGLFSLDHLAEDLEESINGSEMAKRRFRDIAVISGLVFQGYPGAPLAGRHLQASSGLIYEVFRQYDPGNPLLRQAMEEVMSLQFDYNRFIQAMRKIGLQRLVYRNTGRFTPFAFPIMAERLREKLSSEKVADWILRLQKTLSA